MALNKFFFKIVKRLFNPAMVEKPIVVILGATGSGKSRLALEIGHKFNGEILSTDSMQVYRELDIVTNKVSNEEMEQVKHHLINFVDPMSRITVVDFRNRALDVINKLHEAKKIPVIVGGTNYYIESLLWNVLIRPDDTESEHLMFDKDASEILTLGPQFETLTEETISKSNIFGTPVFADSFKNISSLKLHEILMQVDEKSALELHPHDKRKIIRCLQVLQRTSRKYSDLVLEQKSIQGGSELGGPLRFKNSTIFWVQCEKQVLNSRLNKRVDTMIENGLIKELHDFHNMYNKHRISLGLEPDYTKGIFQAIGFKEFHKYLAEELGQESEQFKLCVEDMKRATRKYAKKQIKWISNRFLRENNREVPDVYALDATIPENWNESVKEPAFAILKEFLENEKIVASVRPISRICVKPEEVNEKATFFCNECDRIFQGTFQWNEHMKSRNHKKRASADKQDIKRSRVS